MTPNETIEESNPKRVRTHRAVATALAVIATIALGYTGISPFALGEHIGRSLVILLVVLVLAGWILGKKTDVQKIRLTWVGAILWVVVMTGPILYALNLQKERAAADRAALKTDRFHGGAHRRGCRARQEVAVRLRRRRPKLQRFHGPHRRLGKQEEALNQKRLDRA